MLSISVGLTGSQCAPDQVDVSVVYGTVVGSAISLPASSEPVRLIVEAPASYAGSYLLAANALQAGPLNLIPPQVSVNSITAELTQTGLWAYDGASAPLALSNQWQRDGIDVSGENDPSYALQAADFGQVLHMREVAQTAAGSAEALSNSLQIDTEPFDVVVDATGQLQIQGNDGRAFAVDADENYYDGDYNIPAGSLASGPVTLLPPLLSGPADPIAGDVLTLLPGLVAYDPDYGDLTLDYSVSGAGVLDLALPMKPTYTVDPADVGTVVTVQTLVTQGSNSVQLASNAVDIPGAAGLVWETVTVPVTPFAVALTHTYIVDLSTFGAGDTIVLTSGPAGYSDTITVDGVAATRIGTSPGNSGARLTLYTLTLSGPGSSVASVDVTLPSLNRCTVNVLGVRGGTLVASDFGADQNRIFTPVTLVGAPTAASNLVLSIVHGGTVVFDGPGLSWSGVTEDFYSGPLNNGLDAIAVATAQDVPVAPYTVLIEQDVSTLGRLGAALLIFS